MIFCQNLPSVWVRLLSVTENVVILIRKDPFPRIFCPKLKFPLYINLIDIASSDCTIPIATVL